MRRTGTYDARPRSGRYRHSSGYVLLDEAHPLAKDGRVFEHRKVAYDELGPGPHACHWCGDGPFDWATLTVDHLNEVKDDNRPENLVPACNDCNRARGSMVPFMLRVHPDRVAQALDCLLQMAKTREDVRLIKAARKENP